MTIIAVDDEPAALWALERAIRGAARQAELASFSSVKEALAYAQSHPVDAAFLDIHMSEMNGLLCAKLLKDIRSATNIIFVSGYSRYMASAFDMHASGYVLKPIDDARVREELENLRQPVRPPAATGVRIQCFGSFEVFVDNRPVVFHRPKAKEALAYLVDRKGASVSKKELASVLWENEPYTRSLQSHLYKLISDMKTSLRDAGATEIVILRRGVYALDATKVTCDYFDYLKGDTAAVNSYLGEYMSNYSWAEFTTGLLTFRM